MLILPLIFNYPKVLIVHQVKSLRKPARKKRIYEYLKKTPGECIQMDTCKIAPGTAINDYTRYRILEVIYT